MYFKMKGIRMQAQGTARRGGASFIWKWGAIVGIVLGVIGILLSLIDLGGIRTLIDLVLWLVAFFGIGMFAARQTGRVGTGALTGLVTGLVSGLIGAISAIIQIATHGPQFTQALNQAQQAVQQQGQTISSSDLHTLAVVSIVIGLIVGVALELGLGAGIGALGGLVGRRQAASAAPTLYVESMWTPPPPGPGQRQE
jgi:hypothetical protein